MHGVFPELKPGSRRMTPTRHGPVGAPACTKERRNHQFELGHPGCWINAAACGRGDDGTAPFVRLGDLGGQAQSGIATACRAALVCLERIDKSRSRRRAGRRSGRAGPRPEARPTSSDRRRSPWPGKMAPPADALNPRRTRERSARSSAVLRLHRLADPDDRRADRAGRVNRARGADAQLHEPSSTSMSATTGPIRLRSST